MKCWIEYTKRREEYPLSYWVHKPIDSSVWIDAKKFSPPMPERIVGKGFPVFAVSINSFTFAFGSLYELEECVRVLSRKALPRPSSLAQARVDSAGMANSHWLSRLPAWVKTWKYREKAVKALIRAREHFKKGGI